MKEEKDLKEILRDDQFRKGFQYLKNLHRPTIKQLAQYADCSTRHIQAVLSDKERRGAGGVVAQKISSAFGLTYREILDLGQWLLDGQPSSDWAYDDKINLDPLLLLEETKRDTAEHQEISNVGPGDPILQVQKIPIISWVQAGEWEAVEDPFQPGFAEEWITTTETTAKHAFALTVHGDSMEPEFYEGDILTVDPEKEPVSGSFVIAKNGENATFKQLVLDGSNVYLKPLNNRYPIKDMTGVDFRIVGVVVEKRKRY